MSALIVAADRDDTRVVSLARLLDDANLDVSFVDLEGVNRRLLNGAATASFVFVADPGGEEDLAHKVSQLAAKFPTGPFFVYVAETMAPSAYKELVRSGSGEWVTWQTLAPELQDIIQRRQTERRPERLEAASIVSFLPTSGGVGNTTLAIETAIELASRKGPAHRKVCVLDLNFQNSAIPAYLDMDARLDVNELLGRPDRLDRHLVELMTTHHPSGIDVVCSALSEFDYAKLDADIIFGLLDEIAKRYDFVHLDLPAIWFPWTSNLAIGSDAVLLTGGYGIPAVKRAAHRLSRLKAIAVPPERIAITMNRCETSLFGGVVRRSDIANALADRTIFFLPEDAKLASEAVNLGRSIMQTNRKSRLGKELAKVSDWIDGFAQENLKAAEAKRAAAAKAH